MSKSGSKNGKVYLVGAGPGDLGLVTLRAKECIENADVIVYDHLANPDALGWARDDAEIIYAGKQPGESRTQQEITSLLIDKAREEKQVVRLKGGDPFVFGRGAEEAQEIATAGIAFEIVPGITSAIAGPAYAGIPMTHRAHNSHVTFFTGHEDPTKTESAIDYEALAKLGGTQVMLMGMERLGAVTSEMLKHGVRDDLPVALIRWATTGQQETLTGTPQGGIVSPLLANIYLHELDRYMESTYLNLSSKEKARRRKQGIGNALYVRYADGTPVQA